MDFLDLIQSRTSYRSRYLPELVPREDLRRIIEAGLAAPSGCNKQTTSFIGVDDPALLAELKAAIDPPVAQTAPAAICAGAKDIRLSGPLLSRAGLLRRHPEYAAGHQGPRLRELLV